MSPAPRKVLPGPDLTPLTARRWYPLLVFSIAMALTIVATVVLFRAVRVGDEERFAVAVSSMEDRLQQRMDTYLAMLRGAAGLFDGSNQAVDRQEFAAYVAHLGLDKNYPGIGGMGWIVPVAGDADASLSYPNTEAALLAWLSTQGYLAPRLWPVNEPEQAASHLRTAVLLLEPENERNRLRIGVDMASESVRRAALQRAADTGMPVATGTVLPFFATANDPPTRSFLVFFPVFSHDQARSLRGWVYAPFRYQELLEGLFPSGDQALITVAISTQPTDTGTVFANRPTTADAHIFRTDSLSPAEPSLTLATSHSMPMLTQTWHIEFHTTAEFFHQSMRHLIPVFAVVGTVLSLCLYLLARSQTHAVVENARLFLNSTAARREAELNLDINRRVASALDAKGVASAVTDAGCELTGAAMGIFFTPGKGDTLTLYALSGLTHSHFAKLSTPRMTALFAASLTSPQIIRIADVPTDPTYGHSPTEPEANGGHPPMRSYLAVPVVSRSGPVLGALVFSHLETGRFDANHERLIVGLATQAAIALDNATLFEAEAEAKQLAAQRAEALAKVNAELQQFVYVSSHDLQEPLRTITQYLDLLRRRHSAQLDEQASRYVGYAAESATRLYALLNDLLAYSRLNRTEALEQDQRELVDLNTLIEDVRQDLRVRLLETGADLTVSGPLPTVRCVRSQIRSVFQNLIGNGLKFRDGKPARVVVSAMPLPSTASSASGKLGRVWAIAVADNGIGISPEHHRIIFEVFERLHDREAFPGTGIGLAICRKVVEQHGGEIWVESTVGHGATFRFTLREDGLGDEDSRADEFSLVDEARQADANRHAPNHVQSALPTDAPLP